MVIQLAPVVVTASRIQPPATPAPSEIRTPVPTVPVPNPLNKYASYTYNWSLWWLSLADAANILNQTDVNISPLNLSTSSYCIAEDSGLYPTRRSPVQAGLDYNIQSVELKTTVNPNSVSKHTNLLTGSMIIVEPYGTTFLDTLVAMSYNSATQTFENYLEQPYLLRLDFTGYDDSGNAISASDSDLYRKIFPIRFTEVKIALSERGAEYHISFVPITEVPLLEKYGYVPFNLSVNGPAPSTSGTGTPSFAIQAGSVGEFFENLATNITKFWKDTAAQGKMEFADSILFDIDPNIKTSKIVYDQQMTLAQANPNAVNIDFSHGSFSIPAGTLIVDIIEKILLQSEYVLSQLGLNNTQGNVQLNRDQTVKFNFFRTVVRAEYIGINSSGAQQIGAFDNRRNVRPMQFTYAIHQYPTYDGNNPYLGQLVDSRPQIVKDYQYWYTGKNTDIIKVDVHFDTTYYTRAFAWPYDKSSTDVTASTGTDNNLAANPYIFVTPQLIAQSGLISGFGQIRNPTPMVYQPAVNDRRDTMSMHILGNPSAQAAANAIRSIYSAYPTGDMLNLKLSIIGDPTLIKQDGIFYVPSPDPNTAPGYNASISQADFADLYGHIRMDSGQLVVKFTLNTPLDIDTDWTNQGGVFPSPGTIPSLFTGQYKILTIDHNFHDGVFTQELNIVRFQNDAYVSASAPGVTNTSSATVSSASTTGQLPSSNSTPASEQPPT